MFHCVNSGWNSSSFNTLIWFKMLLNNCIVKDRKRCCKIDLQIAEMVPLSIKISPNCQSTSLVFNDIKENTDSVDFYIHWVRDNLLHFFVSWYPLRGHSGSGCCSSSECLALGVGGLMLTSRWRSDRVEILHYTLQVPHLIVQLLRAVAVVAVL